MLVPKAPGKRPDESPFPEPANPNAKVWRYLDFGKLKFLLNHGALYLRRLPGFQDQLEGKPPITLERQTAFRFISQRVQGVDQRNQWARYECNRWITFASCWRVDEFECPRAWKEYEASVAVCSTFSRLKKSLNIDEIKENQSDTRLGLIRYMDRLGESLPPHNIRFLLMAKDNCYSWERELRVFKQQPEWFERVKKELFEDGLKEPSTPEAIAIEVCLSSFVDEIVLGPESTPETAREIKSLLEKVELDVPIVNHTSRIYRQAV